MAGFTLLTTGICLLIISVIMVIGGIMVEFGLAATAIPITLFDVIVSNYCRAIPTYINKHLEFSPRIYALIFLVLTIIYYTLIELNLLKQENTPKFIEGLVIMLKELIRFSVTLALSGYINSSNSAMKYVKKFPEYLGKLQSKIQFRKCKEAVQFLISSILPVDKILRENSIHVVIMATLFVVSYELATVVNIGVIFVMIYTVLTTYGWAQCMMYCTFMIIYFVLVIVVFAIFERFIGVFMARFIVLYTSCMFQLVEFCINGNSVLMLDVFKYNAICIVSCLIMSKVITNMEQEKKNAKISNRS